MTDHAHMPDPMRVARRLPPHSLIILRDYDHADRLALARQWAKACRENHCLFSVGGDAQLARRVRADGIHWPEKLLPRKPGHKFTITTTATHSRKALMRAQKAGIPMALISPVFATTSHPGAKPLGVLNYRRMVRGVRIAIGVLGGITAQTARRLVHPRPHALAAITAFLAP